MDRKDKFPRSPEVDAFRQTILKTAEDLVVNKFPQRIILLNKMLSSGKLTCDPSSVYQKVNIPIPDMSDKDQDSNTSQKQAAPVSNQGTSASSSSSSLPAAAQTVASNGENGVSYL